MLEFLPLAAVEDWLKIIVPLVFFVIYAINQLLTASKTKPAQPPNNPPRRKPEMAERPLRPAQRQAQPAPGGQAPLNAEIEQFLKRASERRGGRESTEKAPPKAPPRQLRETSVDVEPITPQGFTEVAASVEKHLGDRGFKQRAEHLADDIVRADQQMEEHLQKAFSRKVGTLGDSEPRAAAPVTDAEPVAQAERSPAATALAGLLSNPQNLKQAIVLNEILQRPESRW